MQITEFVDIDRRMSELEQQVADMQTQIAALLPLPAKAGVVYRRLHGDGIYRDVQDPRELEALRAEGKGANIKAFPVRPDLGETRDVRYLGGS
jgi:hypothetical protein